MAYIKYFAVTFVIIPHLAMAMSEESQEYVTVINKTPFNIHVVPRKPSLNAMGRFCFNPQNNHQVRINPNDIKTVTAFPSGTKKLTFFFLTIEASRQLKYPVSTDVHSNTITIITAGSQIYCSKTKSRHHPTPEITFWNDIIDK